ncbi:MAG: DUF4388 domain-containing protein [Myxococcales bacterium]
MAEPSQLWVRDRSSRVWGPLSLATVELMVDHGVVTRPFQISTDGVVFDMAPDDLFAGEDAAAPVLAAGAFAPPVLTAGAGAKTGESAMKAAVAAARASPSAPRMAAGPGQLPPAAPRAPGAGLPPRAVAPGARASATPVAAAQPKPAPVPPPAAAPATRPTGSRPAVEAPAAAAEPAPPRPAQPPTGRMRAIQAAPPSGRLEDQSALRLYYLVAAAEASGKLTLDAGPHAAAVWFKQGTPQAVHSEAQALGPFLVEQRALSEEALAAAVQSSPSDPLGALFASGQINPSSVFPLIQQHALSVLQRALLLGKGPFAFDPNEPPPPSGFPLGNRWEILLGAVRRLDSLTLARRLEGREAQAPRLNGSTAELKLTAVETRLTAALDGSRSLSALLAAFPAEAEALQRLVLLLQELDRLSWEARPASRPPPPVAPPSSAAPPRTITPPPPPPPQAAAAPRPPTAPPAPRPGKAPPRAAVPPPGARPPAPAGAAPPPRPVKPPTSPPRPAPRTSPPAPALKAEPPAKFLAGLREKNLFDRLGLPRSEGAPPQLKSVYLQLAKLYHPDMLPPGATPEQRKQCEDILALLNEANAVLADDGRRKAYLEELAAQEAGVVDMDVEAILRAEEDFQRAVILIKGHKLREGLDIIESCIQLNEKEGEFYAWRGYAKFLLATDKRAAYPQAMAELQRCLKLTPRCPPAHLLEAHMAKLIGDEEAAQKAFKKVLELEPGNVDAQREIRLYQQRKKK